MLFAGLEDEQIGDGRFIGPIPEGVVRVVRRIEPDRVLPSRVELDWGNAGSSVCQIPYVTGDLGKGTLGMNDPGPHVVCHHVLAEGDAYLTYCRIDIGISGLWEGLDDDGRHASDADLAPGKHIASMTDDQ